MDARRILESLTHNPGASSALGGFAGSLLGSVLAGGGRKGGKLMKYGGLAAIGFAITEPIWANVRVAGRTVPVLMQAFERRVLTYTPGNPEGFKVEYGNIGQAYYRWRYAAAAGGSGWEAVGVSR